MEISRGTHVGSSSQKSAFRMFFHPRISSYETNFTLQLVNSSTTGTTAHLRLPKPPASRSFVPPKTELVGGDGVSAYETSFGFFEDPKQCCPFVRSPNVRRGFAAAFDFRLTPSCLRLAMRKAVGTPTLLRPAAGGRLPKFQLGMIEELALWLHKKIF